MSEINSQNDFDIFISYNWDSKDQVRRLYDVLTNEYNYNLWIDFKQLDSRALYEQLVEGIKKSKVILCFITKKYTESENCKREITYASDLKKPLIIIMMERLKINDLGSVGFLIAPLTRINFYHDENIFSSFSGPIFESLIKSVECQLKDTKLEKCQQSKTIKTTSPTRDRSKTNDNFAKKNSVTLKNQENKQSSFELNKQTTVDNEYKDLKNSLNMLNQEIQLNPNDLHLYVNKAEILNLLKQYADSIKLIDFVLKQDSFNTDAKEVKAFALNELANNDFNSNQFDLALKNYNQAIELNPENKVYHLNKASCLRSVKKYDEAIVSLNYALKIDPNYEIATRTKALILNEYGMADYNEKKYNQALIKYNRAIDLNPKEVIFYCNKADCLSKLKKYDEAMKTIDSALIIDPNFEHAITKKAYAYYYLGIYENNGGNYNEALKKFQNAIELNGKEKVFYFNKAGTLMNLKKYKEALDELNKALKLDPNYEDAILRKAQTLSSIGIKLNQMEKYEDALLAFQEAIELDQSDKVIYLNMAVTFNYLKMYDKAIKALDTALDLDPGYKTAIERKAYSLNALGNFDYENGNFLDSIKKYDKAIELNPNDKAFYSNRASALIGLKKFKEALESLDTALQIDPNYSAAIEKKAFALNSLGVIDDKARNFQSALSKYDMAIDLNPNQKVFYANKADTLYMLKRYDDAIKIANIALRLDPNYQRAKEIKDLAKQSNNVQ